MVERTVTIPPRRHAKKNPTFFEKWGECFSVYNPLANHNRKGQTVAPTAPLSTARHQRTTPPR